MGLYKTVFYNNVYDLTKFIVLAKQVDKISELENIIFRGFVKKEDLLALYKNDIKSEDIGEHSYIIEYITSTYNSVEKLETNRIKVV